MAFGFPPKYEQVINLDGYDVQHYLAIAIDAVKQLGWNLDFTGKSGIIAYIGGGLKALDEFLVDIEQGKVTITSKSTRGMLDVGRNKKHVELFISTFNNVKSSLTEQELQGKVTALQPVFDTPDVPAQPPAPKSVKDGMNAFLSLFVPREGYFITPILIDLNFLVFILMVATGVNFFDPSITDILHWGANMRELTLGGQWWRLITCMFLHFGIAHILFNMYALIYVGVLLEPYLGKLRFAAAYLFTGIFASLSSIAWHIDSPSAGASGAIFGMYGVFLAMLTTNYIDKTARKPLLISIGLFVLFNLVYGAAGGIDNAAHIGGLLSGLIIGYCYYPSLERPASPKFKYVTVALLAIVVLFLSFIIYYAIPNDQAKHDLVLKDFDTDGHIAMSYYTLPKSATKDEYLSALKDKGLVNWNKQLQMLATVNKLDALPEDVKHRDSLLMQYCNLRLASYTYIIKNIQENTGQYQPAIDSCYKQIYSVLDSLKKY
jgi:rhomboid protease GluP